MRAASHVVVVAVVVAAVLDDGGARGVRARGHAQRVTGLRGFLQPSHWCLVQECVQ